LRDVLAVLADSETGTRHDVRESFLDTETQLVRLRPAKEQYAVRAVAIESNFNIISDAKKDLYHKIKLESRLPTAELVAALDDELNKIATPEPSSYPSDSIYPSLLQSLQPLSIFDLYATVGNN
jgi:hypothetical protein